METRALILAICLAACPSTSPSEVRIDSVEIIGDSGASAFDLRIEGRGFAHRAIIYDLKDRVGRIDLSQLSLEIFGQRSVLVPGEQLVIESSSLLRARVTLSQPLAPGAYGVRYMFQASPVAELADAFVVSALGKDAGIDGSIDAGGEDAGPSDADPSDADPSDADPFDADPIDGDLEDAGPQDLGLEDAADPIDADAPDADEPDLGVDAGVPDTGAVVFVPSNINQTLMTAGFDSLVLRSTDGLVTINTDTGAIVRAGDGADLRPAGVAFSLDNTTVPPLGIFSATSIAIEAGVTVDVRGTAALVFASSGEVAIAGSIDARGGKGAVFNGGPGGFAGGNATDEDGEGPGGGLAAAVAADDIGAGGAGHAGDGGDGGDRAAAVGPAGGTIYGNAALVPLIGGSGGGVGGGDPVGWGRGGGGGGAVQISAYGQVAISGGINCGGGGGEGGASDDGGGGGGSGGAIAIESPSIVVSGYLTANGGGGGAGAEAAAFGMSGESGRDDALPAAGGVANTDGSAGGNGGAGVALDGRDGVSTTGVGADDNAGGGGGAAGRVKLRSDSRTSTGNISPAPSVVAL